MVRGRQRITPGLWLVAYQDSHVCSCGCPGGLGLLLVQRKH